MEGEAMKCLVCGTAMKARRENFKYDACGLPYVTLVGVDVSRCPKCGEYEVAIPRSEDLHRVIATAVARRRGRLQAPEVRFLRRWLGWSGADFAKHMGVSAETVSRWESGAQRMGATADRLLRLMVASREPERDYSLELLKEADATTKGPFHLGIASRSGRWKAVA
jgi:putative zinc finger/helix-turn-helix YgiT family protein